MGVAQHRCTRSQRAPIGPQPRIYSFVAIVLTSVAVIVLNQTPTLDSGSLVWVAEILFLTLPGGYADISTRSRTP
eukprot:862019-Amorphochlora_amoeboformis.AAC.1